ncbi:MAG: hypothetical protein JXA23_12180, partial [Bacteroidales bacterium]|nr:hypothetical protein [Bacteroidales bacterium]
CGEAILLSPFFLVTHGISMALNIPEEGGFSPLYHWMIDFASVIYLVLGLILLKKVLQRYFSSAVQYLTLLFLYIGTNLYYYTVNDGSMSHVYSFFLFTLFLFSLTRFLDVRKYPFYLLMVFAGSLAVVTRPTNILVFSLFFLWDLTSLKSFFERLKWFFKPVYILTFLGVLFLVLLPQLLYWNYLHGSYITYTYGEEGFTNWKDPFLPEIWFSPLNGLFTYVPMALLMLAGIGLMIFQRKFNGWVALALFLIVSYICGAWQIWYFGCSFGQRSFVEYFAILAIPLGYLIGWAIQQKHLLIKGVVLFLLLFCAWFTLRLTYVYEKCFFGAAWDWDNYHRQLNRAGIPFPGSPVISYSNDFENQSLNGGTAVTRELVRTGIWSATFDEYHEFCCRAEKRIWDFSPDQLPRTMQVSGWVNFPDSVYSKIYLVFSAEKEGTSLKWEGIDLSTLIDKADSWQPFQVSYEIPPGMDGDTRLLFYIWNPEKKKIFVDDLDVRYD